MNCLVLDKVVQHDLRRIVNDPDFNPKNPQEICNKLLFSCYLGTENSSEETRYRAEAIANRIGANHKNVVIDAAVKAILSIFILFAGRTPKYSARGGDSRENLALQNIQVSFMSIQMNDSLNVFFEAYINVMNVLCRLDCGWLFHIYSPN